MKANSERFRSSTEEGSFCGKNKHHITETGS